ncbi:N-alpha-acetyltransferase 40 [Colletotrichum spaethianum]|uniref:N-alpha-acetyltransferase 40 n=1 Tax=Colletotrichum spaethianum TaxID=700344 RepID=A0AA37LC01_9PEZI|nr:N-alpha-acetyltransferase 40 [Colletotrichum spaethianum]GKT41532.1 N-alpha-acetyltransferase 40 [Colletotrichum spaethianum]
MAPPPRKRRKAPTNPIEAANRKTDDQFIKDYLQPSSDWTSWTHPKSSKPYALSLKSSSALAQPELQACFDLIEHTSGADYRASKDGWKPLSKLKEMRSPELRYILVKEAVAAAGGDGDDGEKADEESGKGKICGFTSLMPTFEEGDPVVYCYEIHLMEELRGTGMGRKLMDHLVQVAESIPIIEKVMLTCFLANANARAFYEKLGFERDAISPVERKLRFGKVFVPDYLIMSRRVRGGSKRLKAQTGDGENAEDENGDAA